MELLEKAWEYLEILENADFGGKLFLRSEAGMLVIKEKSVLLDKNLLFRENTQKLFYSEFWEGTGDKNKNLL